MVSKPVEVRGAELRDAWADVAQFKAAVDLAKKDLARAQLGLESLGVADRSTLENLT